LRSEDLPVNVSLDGAALQRKQLQHLSEGKKLFIQKMLLLHRFLLIVLDPFPQTNAALFNSARREGERAPDAICAGQAPARPAPELAASYGFRRATRPPKRWD